MIPSGKIFSRLCSMQTPGFDAYIDTLEIDAQTFSSEIIAVSNTLLDPIQRLEGQFGSSIYIVTEVYSLSASRNQVFEVAKKIGEYGTAEATNTLPVTPGLDEYRTALCMAADRVEGAQGLVAALLEMQKLNRMHDELGMSLEDITAFCESPTQVATAKRRI